METPDGEGDIQKETENNKEGGSLDGAKNYARGNQALNKPIYSLND